MEERKALILNKIIEEHTKTGEPVGSAVIAGKYNLGISPATVRNEMANLEAEGYISQPHTSAGRVPTEKAYRFYISRLSSPKLGDKEKAAILRGLAESDAEQAGRETAKIMAELADGAVFWAFYRHNVYYTGLSNLFKQPEFSQVKLIYDISAVIDRIDEIVDELFDYAGAGVRTLIGAENPFGGLLGSVIAKYRAPDRIGLFGLIGPMRMDYERNIGLVDFVHKELTRI